MSRTLLLRLGFLGITSCLSPLFGQVDADVLRAKYGAPIEATFEVRPGITMSVVYGDKHQVCKLDLRPKGSASVIPVSLISEILDEIVPPFTRGVPQQQSQMGACCSVLVYEKLTIARAGLDVTPDPHAEIQKSLATVQIKSCQSPKE